MSQLTDKTERKAIMVLANTPRFFEDTSLLFVSAADAQRTREAENILRSIIENNGYKTRYQKGSKWYDVIGEKTIADAILDRIVHSAHRIELKGESMRKKRRTDDKEVSYQ